MKPDYLILTVNVITVILVILASISDLKCRKIPNLLTIPAILLGLTLNTALNGLPGLLSAAGGIGLGFSVWFFGMLCGGVLGAGDAKLLMAVGALCGLQFLVLSFATGIVIGGVMAFLIALRHGCLRTTLLNCWVWLIHHFGYQSPVSLSTSASLQIPYAVPIALGVVVCMFWPGISLMTGLPEIQIAQMP